uniref:Uncharacterized protein n=1 Tax=Knipowitschia caucasica TaxID=637954 RepID=A0AAV2KVK4_KNICA
MQVAEIQARSSHMEVMNSNLNSDLTKCETTRKQNAAEAIQQQDLHQKNHDNQVERLLMEQNRLRDQKKLQEDSLALKTSELDTVKSMLANCKPKTGGPLAPAQNKPNWTSNGKTPTVR